jgi:hypothetical protein
MSEAVDSVFVESEVLEEYFFMGLLILVAQTRVKDGYFEYFLGV